MGNEKYIAMKENDVQILMENQREITNSLELIMETLKIILKVMDRGVDDGK